MRDDDIVVIKQEPELSPEELYRRHILEIVQTGLRLAVADGEIRITADNIFPLLKLLNIRTSDEDILDLVRDALIDTGGDIKTEDFGNIVLERTFTPEGLEEETLKEAFDLVDEDGDSIVTGADIYRLMMGMGEVVSDEDLGQMLRTVDTDGDGRITFDDFRSFVLGLESEVVEEEELDEVESTETEKLEKTEAETPPPPVCEPIIQQPLPEHKERRKLFSYGHMIAKQISIVNSLKSYKKDSQKEKEVGSKLVGENVDHTQSSTVDVSDSGNQSLSKNANSEDQDVDNTSIRHTKDEDITQRLASDDHKSKPQSSHESGKIKMSSEKVPSDVLASIEKQILTADDLKKLSNLKPERADVQKSNTPGVDVTEDIITPIYVNLSEAPTQTFQTKPPPDTYYSEKSPYHGRVRPEMFTMNPLPSLIKEKAPKDFQISEIPHPAEVAETSPTAISETGGTVDKETQTTEVFDEDAMAELQNMIKVVFRRKGETEEGDESFLRHNPLKRNSVTLTDLHGIPPRLRKIRNLEKAIIVRRNTSFDLFRTKSNNSENQKFPVKPLSKRMSCQQFVRHSLPTDLSIGEQTLGNVEAQNKIASSENNLDISTENQTNLAKLSFDRRPRSLVQEEFDQRVSLEKRVTIVDISKTIDKEHLYQDDMKKSKHHHGFKSIRPLARVLMAINSRAKAARKNSRDMNSISRVLEQKGIPYVREDSDHGRPRSVTSRTLSKTNSLLKLELPVDKEFKPKLKRMSTLTSIPVASGEKHNLPIFLG